MATQHIVIEYEPWQTIRNLSSEMPARLFAASGVGATFKSNLRDNGGQVDIITADVPDTQREAFDAAAREAIGNIRGGFAKFVGTSPPILPPEPDAPEGIERKSARSRQEVKLPYLRHCWNEAAEKERAGESRVRELFETK